MIDEKTENSLLFIVLLISGLLFTGAGYAGEDSIYSSYTKADGWMTPEVSLVFQGWKDGVYPWDLFGGKQDVYKRQPLEHPPAWKAAACGHVP